MTPKEILEYLPAMEARLRMPQAAVPFFRERVLAASERSELPEFLSRGFASIKAMAHRAEHTNFYSGVNMDQNELMNAFAKAMKDFEGFASASKEKQGELQARLLEIEQKAARRGSGDPGGSFAGSGEDVGALVVKAEGLDALREGQLKNLRIPVKSFPKAALTSTGFPGIPDRDSEIYGELPRRLTVQDLMITRPTSVGVIEYVKSTRVGGAAVQLSEDSPPITDGAVKPEMSMTFTPAQAKVATIAVWTSASRQVLDDNSELQGFINTTLLDAVDLAKEAQILMGSGLTGNLAGLLTEATAYSRHVSGDKWGDTVRRAVTQVQLARGVATGLVINPVALEHIELEKDSQGRLLMPLEVKDANGRTVIWRIACVATDAIGQTDFLLADFSRAARLWDRQQAMVAISLDHADYFVRNLVAILAELRVALTTPRPDLLIKGTFGTS